MPRTTLRTIGRALAWLLVCLATVGTVAACGGGGGGHAGTGTTAAHSAKSGGPPGSGGIPVPVPLPGSTNSAPQSSTSHPNIVFVLTDDLSMDLLRFMPHVQAMEHHGLTFENYFVSDSLCCPSRSSIFTGNLPHNTHVFTNFGPGGGFHAFYRRGEQRHTFAIALQRAGYVTALMGKYLNGYMSGQGAASDGASARAVPPSYVPPGWNEWDVAGWGYPEFNYRMNQDGTLHDYGSQPQDYLTDVVARRGTDFIDRATAAGKPFFLELATFAPHSPYTPAPQDAADFPGLTAPRPASFDRLPTHAPRWLRSHGPLTATQLARIDTVYRLRAQSVQAVDRMIGEIELALDRNGAGRNTYIVFSSDNGLHTGQYRLMPGKLTAFDTDIHVPLVVVGPGVPTGSTTAAIAENIDLAKTFSAIGGTAMRGDGRSLLPLLQGQPAPDWRTAALVEHHGPHLSLLDPDFQQPASGSPYTYEAMRTQSFLYVEYIDGEHEFYDLRRDPLELHNIFRRLKRPLRAQLHTELAAMKRCHGGQACWAAMHVAPVPGL